MDSDNWKDSSPPDCEIMMLVPMLRNPAAPQPNHFRTAAVAACAALATAAAALAGAPPAGAAGGPALAPAGWSEDEATPQDVSGAISEALGDADGAAPAADPLAAEAPEGQAAVQGTRGALTVLETGADQSAAVTLKGGSEDVQALVTAAAAVEPFSAAGAVWDNGAAPARVLARAYQDGAWTDWYELDSDDGPDPASPEGQRAKGASGPLVAAGATGIQLQVLAAPGEDLPEGLAPAVVPDGADQAKPLDENPGDAASPLAQPPINLRASWGARKANYSGNTPKGQPVLAGQLKGAIIHHQVGPNSYTQAQVPGMLRGIQNWHLDGNGWDDIGYNFLVDKYGGLWEGREGGITRNVVGAHATNFNTGSAGLCFLGDMDKAEPGAAALEAAGKLVAWRLSQGGIGNLKGTAVYPGDPKKAPRQVVSGHRDVQSTACPGRYLYAKLPKLRDFKYDQRDKDGVGPKVQTVAAQDMNGDGFADLLVVDNTGLLFLYPGTDDGKLGKPAQWGSGWKTMVLVAPGDWNGDGHADVVAKGADGILNLYPGTGKGLKAKVQIGYGWRNLNPQGAGDMDGDGRPDVLAADLRNGDLYLYRGNGRGGWAGTGNVKLAAGLTNQTLYAAGKLNSDAMADVVAVNSQGELFTRLTKEGGALGDPFLTGRGWRTCSLATGADFTGDGLADIVAACPDQKLYLYRGSGSGGFFSRVTLAEVW
ncbi:MAG: FG-GAP-like repeat-containing protein [Bifidobacteriaceae bacterium]|jgi:hypothetical protein|nr:FG-GAP-like repeat-containing protein [Bifidobacteriaceae bacterium]